MTQGTKCAFSKCPRVDQVPTAEDGCWLKVSATEAYHFHKPCFDSFMLIFEEVSGHNKAELLEPGGVS